MLSLITHPPSTLNELVHFYSTTLTNILNKHARLKIKTIKSHSSPISTLVYFISHHSQNSNQFVVTLKGCGHLLILLLSSKFSVLQQIVIMLQSSDLKKLLTLPLSHLRSLSLKISGGLSTQFFIANLVLSFQHCFPLLRFLQCLQHSSLTKYANYVPTLPSF